jgi:hypothetical protein
VGEAGAGSDAALEESGAGRGRGPHAQRRPRRGDPMTYACVFPILQLQLTRTSLRLVKHVT